MHGFPSWSKKHLLLRGVARGGTWVNAPRHGLKKNLAPELQLCN